MRIEAQHQKTLLLDFPDHLANLSRADRATKLFETDGIIGAPLRSIAALQDLDSQLQQRLYYVVFEQLVSEPLVVMQGIYDWLGISSAVFDPQNLAVKPHESDSHYRYKYLHHTHAQIQPPSPHLIPARIQSQVQEQFDWFYQTFYPGMEAM